MDGGGRHNLRRAWGGQALEGKQFILGDLFTPADIFLGQTLSVADGFGGLVPDKYVAIKAYHKRILDRPAAQKAYA